MSVEVDYGGMAQLAGAAGHQRDYLGSVHSFVAANCANFGAFTGFLAVFGGQYRSAYADAERSLAQSPHAAQGVADRVRASARTYRERDIAASERMKGLETRVTIGGLPTMGPAGPTGPVGENGPLVTRGDKNVAGGTGVVADLSREGENIFNPHVPVNRWDDGPKSLNPLSPIALLGEIESAVNTTADAASVGDDLDDYRDFEEGRR